jgi:2-keto-4-pentenoate hydratase/2-oxohepta-3-ene-1,7-dioic acid hydratase in catechol pathway
MSIRLANVAGRAGLILGSGVADVERTSKGRFSSDPMKVLDAWGAFADWAAGRTDGDADAPLDESGLGPPVPRPSKVFAIGLNYRSHARESRMELPKSPIVFTKFPSCIVGPRADVVLPSGFVDWEVELVVVFGRRGRAVPEARALEYVAGYCVGQDISERRIQFTDRPPQFSMGKSIDTFGPIGPAVVSLDSLRDPNDLALSCDVSGERMQGARTSDLIFSVSQLVAFLSGMCTVEPGDVIFTGTPSGVGSARDPRRYLKPGEEIVSTIEGIGTLVNRCVAAPAGDA